MDEQPQVNLSGIDAQSPVAGPTEQFAPDSTGDRPAPPTAADKAAERLEHNFRQGDD
jgi:hypothetical protein